MRRVFTLLVGALFLVTSDSARADTMMFNAVDDFSTTENSETSVWSYRSSDDRTRSGNYPLLNTVSDPTPTWDPVTPYWNLVDGKPNIGANTTSNPINFVENPNAFIWPEKTLWIHPSSTGLAVLSWLSPGDGVANASFSFADMDPNGVSPNTGDGVIWYVDLNDGSGELASGIIAEAGAPSGPVTVNNVAVSAGDRINFVVDLNQNFFFDSTAVTAAVEFVPEPSALILLTLGLAMLVSQARVR